MGDDLASLACLEKAVNSRPWNTLLQKTRALRDQVVTLTNLNRLDEAEAVLNKAILLNPEDTQLNEDVLYIKQPQLEKQKDASIKVESEIHEQLLQNIDKIFQEKGEEGVKEWLDEMNKK